MSLIKANSVPVLSGTIALPLVGVWTADLVLDQVDGTGFDAGTRVTIKAEDGVELTGTVSPDRSGTFLDSVHVRVVGGAAGMPTVVQPRAYVQPGAYVRDVLNGIATDSGETLSTTISASLLNTNLTAWAVMSVPAVQALLALIDIIAPSAHWRILNDGKLWVGEETWTTATPEYVELSANPSEGVFDLGVDSPSIVPGCTIDGIGKIGRVEHTIEAGKIRTRVLVYMGAEERGIRGAVAAMVRQEISGIDYYTFYDAKVQSQSDDGSTVDLQPVDTRLPGMSRVPLRWGLPGVVAKFAPGTMMRLGWDRGNPQYPYACLSQGGETVTQIQIAGTGEPFVAGTASEIGTLTLTVAGSATLSWTYLAAGDVVPTSGASGQPITLKGKKAQKVQLG